MLCTAVLLSGGKAGYRMVHAKHPCTLWALNSLSNWRWLRELAYELNNEYKFRYNREEDHKSVQVIKDLKEPKIPDLGLTTFAQAMPEEFKDPDAVQAYRKYYAGAKYKFATWRNREIPDWYIELRKKMGGNAEKEVALLLDPDFMKKKRKAAKDEKEKIKAEKEKKGKNTGKAKVKKERSKSVKSRIEEEAEMELDESETESEGEISVYSDEDQGKKNVGQSRGRITTRKVTRLLEAEKNTQQKRKVQAKTTAKKIKNN
jgi:hypothetical protein